MAYIIKKSILYLVLIAIIISLTSCEGGTTFTKILDNKSSDNITIKIFTIYGDKDPVTVHPNQIKEIYWDDQMGFFVDESYNCTKIIDSVKISTSSNKILVKDFMDADNWIRESKSGRNSRESCTFTITDNDLQ